MKKIKLLSLSLIVVSLFGLHNPKLLENGSVKAVDEIRRQCLYDVNMDGKITQGDVDLIGEYVDTLNPPKIYDLNQDGLVTYVDQSMVSAKIGKECMSACVYDIDLDGEIRSEDVDLMDKYFNTDVYPKNFDVNKNGSFDAGDVQRVTWRIGKSCKWNCIYDIDRDLDITQSDIDVLVYYKDKDQYPESYDVNLDGKISDADIDMVKSKLGKKCNTNCVEDIDLDEDIDQSDVDLISKFWNEPAFPIFYDLNRDTKLDVKDVQLVSAKVGKKCTICENPSTSYTKEDLNMMYRAVLGREIKDSEVQSWQQSGAKPEDIIYAILSSQEYRADAGNYIDDIYVLLLGRLPDQSGKDFWLTRGPLELYRGIKNSDEYKQKHPNG